jgi:branched-chain amino acid transport system permease protein
MARRLFLLALVVFGLVLSWIIPSGDWVNKYLQMVLVFIGINIILASSLNLVNGYMGEFSVGHAGFMAVGAYVSSVLTFKVFHLQGASPLFPVAILAGGLAAAVCGLLVAFPSFRTRGDYLAIVTLAFLMIVKSVIENLPYLEGASGLYGMKRLTTLPWVYAWMIVTLWTIRNFIYSTYGRGILAIREDELAADLMGVNTRQVKVLVFVVSSFFAGVAGGLYAHYIQFISPRSFDILKSTDILIMVYLGGIASLGGSILGATLYQVLLEVLRPTTFNQAFGWLPEAQFQWLSDHVFSHLDVWRMMILPLLLVIVMLFRPRGIMGLRELPIFIPFRDLQDKRRPGSGGTP